MTAIVAANGNDESFRFTPVPERRHEQLAAAHRLQLESAHRKRRPIGWITGGDKLVIRGGFARTHDSNFININLNIASAFPFVAAINLPAAGAFSAIPTAQPAGLNPANFARTIVAGDFRSPVYDQFSLEVQRELSNDLVLRVGYVGTQGPRPVPDLDGNPRQPTNNVFISTARSRAAQTIRAAQRSSARPTARCGVIRLRANAAESDYHSMQVSFDKRLSRGFSAGLHLHLEFLH